MVVNVGRYFIGIANTEYIYMADESALPQVELLIPEFGDDISELMRKLAPTNTTSNKNIPEDATESQTRTEITITIKFASTRETPAGGTIVSLAVEYDILSEKPFDYAFAQSRAWGGQSAFVDVDRFKVYNVPETALRPIPTILDVDYDFTIVEP
jgi:hypothetical protein